MNNNLRWHVSDDCIYDVNGQLIIEASEHYMGDELRLIVSEHNMLIKAIELLKKFAFVDPDECLDDRCSMAQNVQDFLWDTYAEDWLEAEINKGIEDNE